MRLICHLYAKSYIALYLVKISIISYYEHFQAWKTITMPQNAQKNGFQKRLSKTVLLMKRISRTFYYKCYLLQGLPLMNNTTCKALKIVCR